MNRILPAFAWKPKAIRYIPIVLAIGSLALLGGCGDDDDGGGAENAAVDQLGSTAEAATYAYAEDGAAGLYDYVAQSVKDTCSVDEFEADLAGSEEPTSFRGMEDAEFDGDTATATVVQIFDTEDRDVVWVFVDEGENRWRITGVPDMDECSPQ